MFDERVCAGKGEVRRVVVVGRVWRGGGAGWWGKTRCWGNVREAALSRHKCCMV